MAVGGALDADRAGRRVQLGTLPPAALSARDDIKITGDAGKLTELLGHLTAPDPDFAIVTP
ncbi:alkyl sulfatase C-terminal domain-containing protein [Streptomyces sp. NPDC005921]